MQVVIPRHSFVTLCSAEAFVKKKKNTEKRERWKKGKGGKNGKGGKSAREREKRRKPLPDFCRNMEKVVDIRPHTAPPPPPPQGNGTSEVV